MTQDSFWDILDKSWLDSSTLYEQRKQAIKDNDEALLEQLSCHLEDTIIENYTKRLAKLSKDELTAFIHIFEERMYNIDRKEIHEHTDGSDDGFLYCRCFILGMGKEYYEMIDKTPSKAKFDLEAESFGFSPYGVYEDVFGEEFDRATEYSIESCSNGAGWKEL
jgi:hypothetical protein